jgi:RNA polymerase sigma factor for flagellar operon FliA
VEKSAADSEKELERVVTENAGLVRKVARRFVRASGGAVDMDDLTSVGMMGLIDAHNRYDPVGGRAFPVYAEFRIRGAIVDEMRRMDPMTQPMRRKARSLGKHRDRLSQELSRSPTSEEMAESMELSLSAYQTLEREVQPHVFLGNDIIPDLSDDISTMPADKLVLKNVLGAAIGSLSERSQQVLALYYYEDLTLREVGTVLELTEARVCQIHKEAVSEMNTFMRGEGFA